MSRKFQSLWQASAIRTVFSNASGTCGYHDAMRAGGISHCVGAQQACAGNRDSVVLSAIARKRR